MKYPRIARIYGELLELEEGRYVLCRNPEYELQLKQARKKDAEQKETEKAQAEQVKKNKAKKGHSEAVSDG